MPHLSFHHDEEFVKISAHALHGVIAGEKCKVEN